MGTECEVKFCDLDSTHESKLTLEPKVDFFELVLAPELFISKLKSSIPQNHILLLDQGIDPVSYTHLTLPTIYSV